MAPILRGIKITLFLLSAVVATLFASEIVSRPTQAAFLTVTTQSVSCMLNIGICPAPTDTTPPVAPKDPSTTPTTTPVTDTTLPIVTISANPLLAGGTAQQVVTITGTVSDANLASYSVAINGNVALTESNMTTTTATINIPWNVSTPNKVPSGSYLITIDATDTSGNPAHAAVTVEVDNTPPTVTLDGGDTIIKSGSISPITTASDKNGVAYNWTADTRNPAVIAFDISAAQPKFTPTVEGSYIYYANVTDTLGNLTPARFNFSYAQQLPPVPLPPTQNPTDALVVQSPATPPVTPTSSDPVVRAIPHQVTVGPDTAVLGNTVTAPNQTPLAPNIGTIASTGSGWSIFGLLWYWWLIIAGLCFVIWVFIKEIIVQHVPQHS